MNSDLVLSATVFSPLCISLQLLWPLLTAVYRLIIIIIVNIIKMIAVQFVCKHRTEDTKNVRSIGASVLQCIN